MTELYIIDLNNNELEVIQKGSFSNTSIDAYLDLSHNNIAILEPGAFTNSRIFHIRLNNNKLSVVKNGVFNGTKFTMLLLSNNNITKLENGCFYDMPNIFSIDMSNNRIETVIENYSSKVPKLRFVNFEGNLRYHELTFDELNYYQQDFRMWLRFPRLEYFDINNYLN